MAWYHKILGIEEKLNPAQQYEGMAIESSREPTQNYEYYYENIEIVNRGAVSYTHLTLPTNREV